MRILAYVIAGILLSGPSFARKSCDELKGEIDARLQEKKVANYHLEIVDSGQASEKKVVGSCDGGTKKVLYIRQKAAPKAPAK